MQKYVALAFGIMCIVAAFWIAFGTTTQDENARPEIAQAFATQLHSSPTPLPTDTPTPIPTITPIPEWRALASENVQVWLPRGFAQMENNPRAAVKRYFSRAPVVGTADLYAYPAALSASSMPNLQIYRVETKLNPRRAPFGMDENDVIVQKPKRIALGRYNALYGIAEKILPSGARFTQMLYWIPHDDAYWLLLFTTHSENAARDLPVFETAARSFTILQAE